MSEGAAALAIEALGIEDGWTPGAFGRDLRLGTGAATEFLPPLPQDEGSWRQLLARARQVARPVRDEVAAALRQRHDELELGPQANDALEAMLDRDRPALAVVTGQQPGLFGGPWLTAYKLAGAVQLAQRLDALGAERVVPVFWLASEDHDFDEANRAGVVGADGASHTLKVDVAATGQSIGHVDVPLAAREAVLDQLRELLPDTERARAAIDALAPREGEDFATWCLRPLLQLFESVGLVVVEPLRMPQALAPEMRFLLDMGSEIVRAVRETGSRLAAAGLPAPLEPAATDLPLFLRDAPTGRRERISVVDGRVLLRDAPTELSADDLARAIDETPERFSGNVIGRVFTQNRILPMLAYVAGPSEIAYQAQVAAAHARLELPFPLAVPRPEATWVLPRQRESASAFGVALSELVLGAAEREGADDAARLAALLDQLPSDLEGTFAPLAALLDGGRGRDAVARVRAQVLKAYEKGRRGLVSAHEADQGVGRARWLRLQAWLRPHGKPQERVHVPIGVAARYGLELIREGLAAMDPRPCRHVIFEAEPFDA